MSILKKCPTDACERRAGHPGDHEAANGYTFKQHPAAVLAKRLTAGIEHFEKTLDDEPMLKAENAILDHLGVSLDETEQGLTKVAIDRIEAFQAEHGERGYARTEPSGPAIRSPEQEVESAGADYDGPEPDGTRYLGGGLYGSTSR